MDKKRQIIEDLQKEMASIENSIRDLQLKVSKRKTEADADLKKDIASLQASLEKAQKDIHVLGEKGDQAFKDVQKGMHESITGLKKSVQKAMARFD